jgi:hypothetical protein
MSDSDCDEEPLSSQQDLLPAHPLVATHCLAQRTVQCVPVPYMPRLPDLRLLDSDPSSPFHSSKDTAALRESYAIHALVFALPWREAIDLRLPCETMWGAFSSRKARMSPFMLKVLRNFQAYHEAWVLSDAERAEIADAAQDGELAADEHVPTSEPVDIVLPSSQDHTPLEAAVSDILMNSPVPVSNVHGEISLVNAQDALVVLAHADKDHSAASASSSSSVPESSSHISSLPLFASKPTLVLELIESAINPQYEPPSVAVVQLPEPGPVDFPTIAEHAARYSFNHEQHQAFFVLASAVLERVALRMSSLVPPQALARTRTQFRLSTKRTGGLLCTHISGSAGTGKSRIVHAVKDFANRWSSADILMITATTGLAASNIEGQTLHRACGASKFFKPGALPTPERVDRWSPVGLLIVDECGMVKAEDFLFFMQRLRHLKPSANFLHIAWMGDFYQLGSSPSPAPFHSSHISSYSVPLCSCSDAVGGNVYAEDLKFNNPARREARLLWQHSVDSFVELKTLMRQDDASEFAVALQHYRVNRPRVADLALVNTRKVTKTLPLPPVAPLFVVPSNSEREAINRLVFRKTCEANPVTTETVSNGWRFFKRIRIVGSISSKHDLTAVVPKIRQLSETELDDKPGTLDIVLGALVVVLDNAAVSCRVANGTRGNIHDVVLRQDAKVSAVRCALIGQIVHQVSADDVVCLVIRHLSGTPLSTSSFFPSLPLGCFPICCRSSNHYTPVEGVRRLFTFTQLPVTSAYCTTGHKAQGLTLPGIAIASMHGKSTGNEGWLYVCLSRVRKLEHLFLFQSLSSDPSTFKPREAVDAEMERLRALPSLFSSDVAESSALPRANSAATTSSSSSSASATSTSATSSASSRGVSSDVIARREAPGNLALPVEVDSLFSAIPDALKEARAKVCLFALFFFFFFLPS